MRCADDAASYSKQTVERNYRVKETVGLNRSGKVSVVNERGSYGISWSYLQPPNLSCDIVHHLLADFGTPFHLDNVGGSFRLEKQINLDPFSFSATIPVGRGRIDE